MLALVALLALLALLCYMACLLGSISAAWDGFGSHFKGLGDILGIGWVPDWPRDCSMGWHALPPGAGALFYQTPGIQVTAKVEGDLPCLDPIINLTTAGYKDLSIQNCMIQDSGRKL